MVDEKENVFLFPFVVCLSLKVDDVDDDATINCDCRTKSNAQRFFTEDFLFLSAIQTKTSANDSVRAIEIQVRGKKEKQRETDGNFVCKH